MKGLGQALLKAKGAKHNISERTYGGWKPWKNELSSGHHLQDVKTKVRRNGRGWRGTLELTSTYA